MRDTITLCEEWVGQRLLAANLPLVGQKVYPSYVPSGIDPPYITHDLGYAEISGPMHRSAPDLIVIRWEIISWSSGQSRQAMTPVWTAVFAALLGADGAGIAPHTYTSLNDGSLWSVASQYFGPIAIAAIDPKTEGEWQRICHGIRLYLSPAS